MIVLNKMLINCLIFVCISVINQQNQVSVVFCNNNTNNNILILLLVLFHWPLSMVITSCAVELYRVPCASSLSLSILHLTHGFQYSPTLNRQPYKGRQI